MAREPDEILTAIERRKADTVQRLNNLGIVQVPEFLQPARTRFGTKLQRKRVEEQERLARALTARDEAYFQLALTRMKFTPENLSAVFETDSTILQATLQSAKNTLRDVKRTEERKETEHEIIMGKLRKELEKVGSDGEPRAKKKTPDEIAREQLGGKALDLARAFTEQAESLKQQIENDDSISPEDKERLKSILTAKLQRKLDELS